MRIRGRKLMDPVVHHSNELSIRFHISVRMDSLSATCPDVLWGRVQTEVHFHVAGMWLYGSGEGFFVCIQDSRSLAEGSRSSNAEARRCISQIR